jgi:hypothetical protein
MNKNLPTSSTVNKISKEIYARKRSPWNLFQRKASLVLHLIMTPCPGLISSLGESVTLERDEIFFNCGRNITKTYMLPGNLFDDVL